MYGIVMVAFKFYKAEHSLIVRDDSSSSKQIIYHYKKLKAWFLCFLAVFPLIFIPIYFIIKAQVNG